MPPTRKSRNVKITPKVKSSTPKAVEQVNLSDDEDIDDDEAFNSDDERRYGHFFGEKSKSKSGTSNKLDEDDQDASASLSDDDYDDDGIMSNDDDSEDGDGGQYMMDLLENLDKSGSKGSNKSTTAATYTTPESEFSASVVQGTQLTMQQLMAGITETKGFSSLAKLSVDNNKSNLTTAKTPASRVVSERAMRKVQYVEQSKDVSLWTDAIQENRRAETLDFRCKERMRLTRDSLVSTFTPTNDFELEVQHALEAAGTTEQDINQEQQQSSLFDMNDDDLGKVTLTLQEYKKRQGDLQKMRALMFYEEIKMHHINKIKSKKYRKIRKRHRDNTKQKEFEAQLEDGDPEMLKELQEKEEMERMKERMTLAHKNTSKWAKQQLGRKGKIDVETRRALSEQIRIGDELRRKMRGVRGDDDEDNEDEDDDNEENLIAKARLILQETSNDADNDEPTGVFKMAFMQRGLQLQRERAKEEARKLLEELEGNLSADDNDNKNFSDIDNDDNDNHKPAKNNKKKTTYENSNNKANDDTTNRTLSAMETAKLVPVGKLLANSLQFGKSNEIKISGNINIGTTTTTTDKDDVGMQKVNNNTARVNNEFTDMSNYTEERDIFLVDMAAAQSAAAASRTKVVATPSVRASVVRTTTVHVKEEEDANPWMLSKDKKKKNNKRKVDEVLVNIKEAAAFALSVSSGEPATRMQQDDLLVNSNKKSSPSDDTNDISTVNLTQAELVRRAFAAPTEAELLEEFELEKNDLKDKDDPTRKVENTANKVAMGWGSWAGEGVVAPTMSHQKTFPKHLQPPEKKKAAPPKKKKQAVKTVILNDRRVKKNLKFQIPHIPYPYRSREEYEMSMAGAIGKEWNVSGAVKSMTRPEIQTTKGRIIGPLTKKAKVKRGPAKF